MRTLYKYKTITLYRKQHFCKQNYLLLHVLQNKTFLKTNNFKNKFTK